MNLDVRYAAGLFDGEGWITICKQMVKNRPDARYQLVVGIGMVHRPVIEALQSTFGGNLFLKKPSVSQSERTRTGHIWRVSSGPAAEFLEKVLPHLIVKRDEALLALSFQRHISANRSNVFRGINRDALIAEREEIYLQLRAMKRREFVTSD